jgi:hypothetical protein
MAQDHLRSSRTRRTLSHPDPEGDIVKVTRPRNRAPTVSSAIENSFGGVSSAFVTVVVRAVPRSFPVVHACHPLYSATTRST